LALRDKRWDARRADIPRIVSDIYGKDARKEDDATGRASERALAFSVRSWLARDIPEPDILLGPFSTTSRGMFVANTGLGKTNLAMAIAFAMAAGQSFLHWTNHRAARALFIDGEMSRRLLRSRIREAVNRCGQIPDELHFISCDEIDGMAPLNTEGGQAYVNSLVDHLGGIDFVFFDNVQSLLSGDMKDEEPWKQTLPWIRDLTRRNIGQLWIHHTGHDPSRSYGTKTREWQLDMVMLGEALQRADTDIAFSLKFTKARERTPDNRQDFDEVTVILSDDKWGVEASTTQKRKKGVSPLAQKFLAALHDALAAPGATIHRVAGRSAVTIDAWKLECRRLGLLDDEKPASERALLSENRRALIAANAIVVSGESVWPL
jgi:hypothetical protein